MKKKIIFLFFHRMEPYGGKATFSCVSYHDTTIIRKSFLLRFFGMATKYFDLGINIIKTTFLVQNGQKMYQNVRGSRNRCICRRAVAIVSK